MSYTTHCFMPGHTLEAVIRLKNRHDMPKDEVLQLVEVFNRLNGYPTIRPGSVLKIPTSLISDGEGSDPD